MKRLLIVLPLLTWLWCLPSCKDDIVPTPVDNTPHPKPLRVACTVLQSPQAGSTVDTLVGFGWSLCDSTLLYHIEVSADSNFGTKVVDRWLAGNSLSVGFPLNGHYYWRVRSKHVAGDTSQWTAKREFYTTPLGTFLLRTPVDGKYFGPNEPLQQMYSWDAYPGAAKYKIITNSIYPDIDADTFSKVEHDNYYQMDEYDPSCGCAIQNFYTDDYTWYVQALDARGTVIARTRKFHVTTYDTRDSVIGTYYVEKRYTLTSSIGPGANIDTLQGMTTIELRKMANSANLGLYENNVLLREYGSHSYKDYFSTRGQGISSARFWINGTNQFKLNVMYLNRSIPGRTEAYDVYVGYQ